MWNFLHLSARRRRSRQSLGLALAPLVAFALPLAAHAAPPVATNTTLTVSSPSVASSAVVTLTASVTASGAPIAAGSVTFCDATAPLCEDAAILANAQLVAGVAQYKFVPGIGAHSYKAIFRATAAGATSTSAAQSLTVTGLYGTMTGIAASGDPSGYTLTATVTGAAIHPPVLAGTVSFQDTTVNNAVLGTASLGVPSFSETFNPAPSSPTHVGNQPSASGVGDFNKDGHPDAAIFNAGDNTISILLGNGDGSFTYGQVITGVGTSDCIYQDQPSNCSLAVGDVNGDGNLDLAATNGGDNTVTVLLGAGNGTFTQANGSPIPTGTFPEAVKMADVNNDGLLDLVVANAKDNTVSILLGKGDGTFTPAPGAANPTGGFPFFLAVADFNRDGALDIAATNEDDSTLSILLGNGDGTFIQAPGSPVSSLSYNPGPVVSADFNGDGIADLAVANFTPIQPSNNGDVVILMGNGDGTFTQAPQSPIIVGVDPFALAIADFNQDGKTDLAVDNYGQIEQAPTQTLQILLGDGTGAFTTLGTPFQLGDSPNDLGVADFNGDGTTDFVIPQLADFNTAVFLNYFTQTATASVSGITIAGTGTHYADAVYEGSNYFAPSTSATVPLQGHVVPTTLALTATPAEQMITMPVTFTAQLTAVSPTAPSAAPTGTVTFYDQSVEVQLGTAPMGANGQAVFTTTTIGPGIHSITASYNGDANYLSSNSGSAREQIDELMIARVGNNNTTILPGTTVVYTLQVTPQVASAFLYNVNFSVTGLPAGAAASFSPPTLAAGGKQANITMTVTTAAASAGSASNKSNAPPLPSPLNRLPLALGFLLPLFGSRALRKRLRALSPALGVVVLGVLGLAAGAGLSGCSGAGLFAARKVPYSITVIATEGTVQRTTRVPLAIQ